MSASPPELKAALHAPPGTLRQCCPPCSPNRDASEKPASGPHATFTEANVWQELTFTPDPWRGHDYMHARYYSPGLGRFATVDPVGGKVGSSQSWNRYGYVSNNPLNLIDPTGEAGKETGDCENDQCSDDATQAPEEDDKGWGRRFIDWLFGDEEDEDDESDANADTEREAWKEITGEEDSRADRLARMREDVRDAEGLIVEEVATAAALGAFSRIKPVGSWLPARLRRSKSYHSEYANYSIDQLKAMKGDPKARQMLKLAQQAERLMEKVTGK